MDFPSSSMRSSRAARPMTPATSRRPRPEVREAVPPTRSRRRSPPKLWLEEALDNRSRTSSAEAQVQFGLTACAGRAASPPAPRILPMAQQRYPRSPAPAVSRSAAPSGSLATYLLLSRIVVLARLLPSRRSTTSSVLDVAAAQGVHEAGLCESTVALVVVWWAFSWDRLARPGSQPTHSQRSRPLPKWLVWV